MERESQKILQILEMVQENDRISQRELARRLSISVGLVNQFMKRLIRKGYFKITTLPPNRVKYLLTPKGFSEKSRLTLEYMRYSLKFYGDMKEILRSTFARMIEEGITRVVFYGTGEVAELAYLFLQETELELAGVVGEGQERAQFFVFPVRPVEALGEFGEAGVLIADLEEPEKKKAALEEMTRGRGKVFSLRP